MSPYEQKMANSAEHCSEKYILMINSHNILLLINAINSQ